jgi:hypothetical protein
MHVYAVTVIKKPYRLVALFETKEAANHYVKWADKEYGPGTVQVSPCSIYNLQDAKEIWPL